MHWVDRGPEPGRLDVVRARETPAWVRCYVHGHGSRPNTHYWTHFRDDLKRPFHGLCAYCEEIDPGEVDHFRPKSKHPHLVYAWDNWVFSCHPCNQAKRELWPLLGYVDPCAVSTTARPERYFAFCMSTGRIIERNGLSIREKIKAQRMIRDLKLNEWYHIKERKTWICYLNELPSPLPNRWLELVQKRARRCQPLSSVTRAWLEQHGYPFGPQ